MQRILVALDGSEHSDKALDLASDIAAKYGAELVLLHVMSDSPLSDGERYLAETEYVDELLSSLQAPVLEGGDARLRAERVLRYYSDVARRFRQAFGERLIRRAQDRAREKGVQTIQTVLEGGDPGEVAIVNPGLVETAFNRGAIRRLGLEVPETEIEAAGQVIR